jgi:hypothetical protein
VSGIFAGIYRVLLYSGKVSQMGSTLPHNFLQLCALAFLIAIASDARFVASARPRARLESAQHRD